MREKRRDMKGEILREEGKDIWGLEKREREREIERESKERPGDT